MPGSTPTNHRGLAGGGNPVFSVLDIDGDGTAEILRDVTNTNGTNTTYVTSPTMNTTLTNIPPAQGKENRRVGSSTPTPTACRTSRPINSDSPNVIWLYMGTGKGFTLAGGTTLPAGAQVSASWMDGYENNTAESSTSTTTASRHLARRQRRAENRRADPHQHGGAPF